MAPVMCPLTLVPVDCTVQAQLREEADKVHGTFMAMTQQLLSGELEISLFEDQVRGEGPAEGQGAAGGTEAGKARQGRGDVFDGKLEISLFEGQVRGPG